MTINETKRNETADLLKGLAVLFMIQVHIMEQFASHDVYNSIIGRLSLFVGGPPCAPVFLTVMGYFLLSKPKPLWYYLKRGGILFAGGILLNILRTLHLFIYILGDKVVYNPAFYIFGVDILSLAGLSIIIIGVMQLVFKKNYIAYLISAIFITLITPILPMFGSDNSVLQYTNAFLWGNYQWSYFSLFPWFAYVLIGVAYHLFTDKYPTIVDFNNRKLYLFLIPVFIILLATFNYGINTSYDLFGNLGYYNHSIKFFVWVVLFLFVYVDFIKFVDKYLGNNFIFKFIKWTGKNVTAIYVVQWIIIGNIATVLYKTQSIYQNIAWFVAITTFTSLIVLSWVKINAHIKLKDEDII